MKQLIDQFAHFVVCIIILMLPFLIPFGFVLSGFLIGFVREQGQHGWKFWQWQPLTWLDMTFWTIGGLTCETIFRSL